MVLSPSSAAASESSATTATAAAAASAAEPSQDTAQAQHVAQNAAAAAAAAAAAQSSHQHAFLQRVSNILPLVNMSLSQISNVYEATKNASSVVKYSAESVESGVKTITKPVFDTLEPALAPLDRFACDQLDKLERSVPYLFSSNPSPKPDAASQIAAPITTPATQTAPASYVRHPSMDSTTTLSTAPRVERKPRSKWHQVVAGVGANLGVITEDTVRTLRYCLQYLQHAINNIDRQIRILAEFMLRAGGSFAELVAGLFHGLSIEAAPHAAHSGSTDDLLAVIGSVKREIVETVRKVVDVIGRNASVYLPSDARQSVRGFILNLPSRLPAASDTQDASTQEPPETAEAKRVLTLAAESSSMLKGIETVISQTVDMLGNISDSSDMSGTTSASLSHVKSSNAAFRHRQRRRRPLSRPSSSLSNAGASSAGDEDADINSESPQDDEEFSRPASSPITMDLD
eukprot:jgi/Hompol1/3768/HPOL_003347-RA